MTRLATNVRTPASGQRVAPSAANRNAALPSARAAQILAPGYCPRLKFLNKLIAEQRAYDARQASQAAASSELARLVAEINTKAAAVELSARQLTSRIGLSLRTWRRVCNGTASAPDWLPKVRAIAERLRVSPFPPKLTRKSFKGLRARSSCQCTPATQQ